VSTTRHVSGITFIRYVHSQTIGKPNDLNRVWEKVIQRGINSITKVGCGLLCPREELLNSPFTYENIG
jgi:hypothetical protein